MPSPSPDDDQLARKGSESPGKQSKATQDSSQTTPNNDGGSQTTGGGTFGTAYDPSHDASDALQWAIEVVRCCEAGDFQFVSFSSRWKYILTKSAVKHPWRNMCVFLGMNIFLIMVIGMVVAASEEGKVLTPGGPKDWFPSHGKISEEFDAYEQAKSDVQMMDQLASNQGNAGGNTQTLSEQIARRKPDTIHSVSFFVEWADGDLGRDVLVPGVLKRICEIERIVVWAKEFPNKCYKGSKTSEENKNTVEGLKLYLPKNTVTDRSHCMIPPGSVTALFYDHSTVGTPSGVTGITNGYESCPLLSSSLFNTKKQQIYGTLQAPDTPDVKALKTKYSFYVDRNFDPTSSFVTPFTPTTRSVINLGAPLDGYNSRADRSADQQLEYKKLWSEVDESLLNYFGVVALDGPLAIRTGYFEDMFVDLPGESGVENAGKKLRFTWFGAGIQRVEMERSLNTDMRFVLFALIFVWAWLTYHSQSGFIGGASILQIFLSMPFAYFWFRVVLGIPYFTQLNGCVVFLACGIGADDIFVFTDAFQEAKLILRVKWRRLKLPDWQRPFTQEEYVICILLALKRTANAVFNTSFTTCCAFLATALSPIMPISGFGIFATITIISNYIFCVLNTPAILYVADTAFEKKTPEVPKIVVDLKLQQQQLLQLTQGPVAGEQETPGAPSPSAPSRSESGIGGKTKSAAAVFPIEAEPTVVGAPQMVTGAPGVNLTTAQSSSSRKRRNTVPLYQLAPRATCSCCWSCCTCCAGWCRVSGVRDGQDYDLDSILKGKPKLSKIMHGGVGGRGSGQGTDSGTNMRVQSVGDPNTPAGGLDPAVAAATVASHNSQRRRSSVASIASLSSVVSISDLEQMPPFVKYFYVLTRYGLGFDLRRVSKASGTPDSGGGSIAIGSSKIHERRVLFNRCGYRLTCRFVVSNVKAIRSNMIATQKIGERTGQRRSSFTLPPELVEKRKSNTMTQREVFSRTATESKTLPRLSANSNVPGPHTLLIVKPDCGTGQTGQTQSTRTSMQMQSEKPSDKPASDKPFSLAWGTPLVSPTAASKKSTNQGQQPKESDESSGLAESSEATSVTVAENRHNDPDLPFPPKGESTQQLLGSDSAQQTPPTPIATKELGKMQPILMPIVSENRMDSSSATPGSTPGPDLLPGAMAATEDEKSPVSHFPGKNGLGTTGTDARAAAQTSSSDSKLRNLRSKGVICQWVLYLIPFFGMVLPLTALSVFGISKAILLVPPRSEEQWFQEGHMFNGFRAKMDNAFVGSQAEQHVEVFVTWGIKGINREQTTLEDPETGKSEEVEFSIWRPSEYRGYTEYSEGFGAWDDRESVNNLGDGGKEGRGSVIAVLEAACEMIQRETCDLDGCRQVSVSSSQSGGNAGVNTKMLIYPGTSACPFHEILTWANTTLDTPNFATEFIAKPDGTVDNFHSRIQLFRSTIKPGAYLVKFDASDPPPVLDSLPSPNYQIYLGYLPDASGKEMSSAISRSSSTMGNSEKLKLKFVSISHRSTLLYLQPHKTKLDVYTKYENLMDSLPSHPLLGKPIHTTSLDWAWLDVERRLISTLFTGLALCFPMSFLVLLFASQNFVIATLAILAILQIVGNVMGFFKLQEWDLGVAESVAGVIVIGFSIDYTLHFSHVWEEAGNGGICGRVARTKYTLEKMGNTVLAGAVTTAGAGSMMLVCQMLFFKKMAIMISVTIFLSLVYTLFWFLPMLLLFGPSFRGGSLEGVREGCKKRVKSMCYGNMGISNANVIGKSGEHGPGGDSGPGELRKSESRRSLL